MFTIIYEKSTGNVLNITSESNADELRKAIPETSDFIFVNELPQVIPYRQVLKVVNNALTVENLQLTAEQEKEISIIEINTKINILKEQLAETDYKALKFIDGEFTEEEYTPIRKERKNYRIKINELEKCLENFKS